MRHRRRGSDGHGGKGKREEIKVGERKTMDKRMEGMRGRWGDGME